MRYTAGLWRSGPVSKTGYGSSTVNAGLGVVCHSMVGYYAGAMGELDKLERRASWHFSVLKDGTVYQHYDTNAITWHCGSLYWNERLIGIEHEGGYDPTDEPLTEMQRAASVKLVRWLSEMHNFPRVRYVGLHEHNEVAPPNDATSCPSSRIPWDAYEGEEPMTPEERKQLDDTARLVKELAKQQFDLAVDQNNRLIVIEDKLGIKHD